MPDKVKVLSDLVPGRRYRFYPAGRDCSCRTGRFNSLSQDTGRKSTRVWFLLQGKYGFYNYPYWYDELNGLEELPDEENMDLPGGGDPIGVAPGS